jgi:hypothetical protein
VKLLLSIFLAAAEQQPPTNPSPKWPFMRPSPVWGDHVWPWLLVPLCIGIAIVYKSIKCRTMKQVPKEAAILTLWILAGMALVAIGLAIAVEAMERSYR